MDVKLKNLKSILEKPQNMRDTIDLNLIASYISNVKFFDSLKDQKSIFKECCTYINYEFVPNTHYVFKEGEIGDKFYILLKGKAGVIITIRDKETVFFKEVLEYNDGSSFGELALKDNKPRAASIFAKADCHFAVLDKFNYNRILSSILIKKRNEMIEFLRTQPFFKTLTKGSVLKLSYCFEEKSIKRDQILFREGDASEFLYLVREGEMKLSQNVKIQMIDSADPVTKATICLKKFIYKTANIGIIGVGEMLGLSDLDNRVYSATCVCYTQTAQVLVISKKDFKRRVNNQDSLDLISEGTMLRNSIHENSVKSMTKILKARVYSPYKKILFDETVGKNFLELKSHKGSPMEHVTQKSEISDFEEESVENKSFDLQVKDEKKRKRRMFEEIRILNSSYDKGFTARMSQTRSLDSKSQKLTRIKKKNTRMDVTESSEVRDSFDCGLEGGHKRISLKKSTVESIISKFKVFGRNRVVYQTSKDAEVVNIHTPSKKTFSLRPNTPKNWSFRTELRGTRRPQTNTMKHRES